jgi:hypothetical protein
MRTPIRGNIMGLLYSGIFQTSGTGVWLILRSFTQQFQGPSSHAPYLWSEEFLVGVFATVSSPQSMLPALLGWLASFPLSLDGHWKRHAQQACVCTKITLAATSATVMTIVEWNFLFFICLAQHHDPWATDCPSDYHDGVTFPPLLDA